MPFIKVEDVREQLEVSSATAKNIVMLTYKVMA
jgi:hypothetical protein